MIVYLQRKKKVDGVIVEYGVVEIPERHVEQTLKQHPLWEKVPTFITQVSVPQPKFSCPLCEDSFVTQKELKTHKKAHE